MIRSGGYISVSKEDFLKTNWDKIQRIVKMKDEKNAEQFQEDITAGWQHEYYDDTGGRSHNTAVDLLDWESFKSSDLQGRKVEHIKSSRLVTVPEMKALYKFIKGVDQIRIEALNLEIELWKFKYERMKKVLKYYAAKINWIEESKDGYMWTDKILINDDDLEKFPISVDLHGKEYSGHQEIGGKRARDLLQELDTGPEEEDGPWAPGWEERSGK